MHTIVRSVLIVGGILLVGFFVLNTYLYNEKQGSATEIRSFEACVAAGYPVMESYPEQCATPDGRTFTREIPDAETAERTVQLYYYDPKRDTDASGNIMCSEAGLVSVERTIPITETPIQDTIDLLLTGDLTEDEAARGVTTEYPLDDFALVGASLEGDTLILAFDDPNNATSGGSCRASILWFQIRETALQFEAINEVRFQPESIFQP